MAEYVDKARLDELFSRYGLNPKNYHTTFNEVFPSFAFDKEILPTIDIVTCKDCKHIDRTICLTSFPEKYGCKLGNGAHRLDFFCADGEVE